MQCPFSPKVPGAPPIPRPERVFSAGPEPLPGSDPDVFRPPVNPEPEGILQCLCPRRGRFEWSHHTRFDDRTSRLFRYELADWPMCPLPSRLILILRGTTRATSTQFGVTNICHRRHYRTYQTTSLRLRNELDHRSSQFTLSIESHQVASNGARM